MANTEEIKKRIKSIKSIEKITAAMKMVAAARLKKFQSMAEDARPYSEYLQRLLQDLSTNSSEVQNPLFIGREESSVLYIVIGAEAGLCGSYNSNIMNRARRSINKRIKVGHKVNVIPIGKKSNEYFRKLSDKVTIIDSLTNFGVNLEYSMIENIVNKAREMFISGEVDAVYLVYAKFKNAMSQVPTVNKLLPLVHDSVQMGDTKITSDMIFEPDVDTILNQLLPQYLITLVYHSTIEAMASEFGAKMNAMTAANQNAQDIISDLSLEYNKIRQGSITNELIDIVNGVNALN